MKQILLPIIGVAIFIAFVGFLTKRTQTFKFNPTPTPESKKEIRIDSTTIRVDLADTESERRNGLSGRESLEQDEGLLFIFDRKDIFPTFWMKDMKFPIDIIWINDEKIVKIDKNVPPPPEGAEDKNLKLYNPDKPIDYVLEVNAGFSDRHNIKVGDGVEGLALP